MRTVYKVRILASEYCSDFMQVGCEGWARRCEQGLYWLKGELPNGVLSELCLFPEQVQVLQSAVEFDTAATHVELGYVFEQRKELALPEDMD